MFTRPNSLQQIASAVGFVNTNLDDIKGVNFDTSTTSLYLTAQQVALNQVLAAICNTPINLPVVGATNASNFNSAMANVFTSLKTALTTPNNSNITAVSGYITTAQGANLSGTATSAYTVASVLLGLQGLKSAVTNWLAFYS